MKTFLSFFTLLLFSTFYKAYCQDIPIAITQDWATLKTELINRTDLVINLSGILAKSKTVNKTELSALRTSALAFVKYLDSLKNFDSLSITEIKNKNNKLTQSLTKTIVSFESDSKFDKRNEVIDLLAQLEGTENRIALARNVYNETCKQYDRPGLQFLVDDDEKAVQVKF